MINHQLIITGATLLHKVAPFGVAGGGPGALGRNWVERAGGERVALSGTDKVEMGVGDVFLVETPGGGYGPPEQEP